MKPILFIGSSSEGIEIAENIQAMLDDCAEVKVWKQEGVFELSFTIIESLVAAIKEAHFSLFILSKDDVTKIRRMTYHVPRDNVIFELGLAFGSIGRERSCILAPENTAKFHVPTDLWGVNTLTYDPKHVKNNPRVALMQSCDKMRRLIRKLGMPLQNSSIKLGKKDVIRTGKSVIKAASNNIVMFASDMSWAKEYKNELQSQINKGIGVLVLCEKIRSDKIKENASLLRGIGVDIHECPLDFKLRATLIDSHDEQLSWLFIANKTRLDNGFPTTKKTSSPDSLFVYRCQIYKPATDPVIIKTITSLYKNITPRKKWPKKL